MASSDGAPTLTLLAFTDSHGRALDWDYMADAEPATPGSLARIATLVRGVRAENPATLLFDVGDTIEGTPMMSLATGWPEHPMATALNALRVDAAAIGNHEFNFGLDHLAAYVAACRFPVLAANYSGVPGVGSHVIREVDVAGVGPVRVGVLGVSTPGSVIWDKLHLAGAVQTGDPVDAAARAARDLRADGADIVVALSHAGLGPSTTYGDALPWPENDTARLIHEVPGIDAVFLGHKHVEEVGHLQRPGDGYRVPYVEPLCHGQRLARIDLRIYIVDGRVRVADSSAASLPVADVPADESFVNRFADAHERTRAALATRIATASEPIAAWPVSRGPSPALDLVNTVQADAVEAALAARGQRRRVLSTTALFGRHDGLPAGDVRVRDVHRIAPFENLLQAVELTAADLLAYLEQNALGFGATDVPAYNVDSLGSATHDVSYLIDVGAPAGSRVRDLRIDGAAPEADERLVVAMSNYRASGGGGFDALRRGTVVYDERREVRRLIIDWIRARGTLRPADIRRATWSLS